MVQNIKKTNGKLTFLGERACIDIAYAPQRLGLVPTGGFIIEFRLDTVVINLFETLAGGNDFSLTRSVEYSQLVFCAGG